MRALFAIIAISVLLLGCQKQGRAPLVVEDTTPIVGANQTTTEALGIETLGGVFTPLIKPGTRVPCSLTEIFSTAADGQTQIMVSPFRGTNQMAASNRALGKFQIVGIPSAPRGTPQVEVTFTITERQILLSARDLTRETGLEISESQWRDETMTANDVTSADGGWRFLFAFVAQRPTAAEFCCSA